jgi:hypothetical protein
MSLLKADSSVFSMHERTYGMKTDMMLERKRAAKP